MPESYSTSAPDKVEARDKDEVSLLINDKLFKYWNDITIVRSFDTIADQFSLSCPFFPDNLMMRDLFRPFKYNQNVVYIGEEKVLTGSIAKITSTTANESKTVAIEGYSLPGILADCHPALSSWPLSIIGLDLKQIAEKLAKPYDITVLFDGSPGAKFTTYDRIEVEIDEKVNEFLTRLARERGFVLSSTVDGELIFQKTTSESATVKIEEGKPPFLNASATFDGQTRYSDVTMVKSSHRKGIGGLYTIKDIELVNNGIFRQLVDKADHTEKGNLQTASIWKLGRILAESISISISCVGWFRPDGKLWQDGQKIIFYAPGCMIYDEIELLVREARLSKKNNEMMTDLTVVLPESYTGTSRTEFPWAS